MNCPDIIFWYTGALVWTFVGCAAAAAVILAMLWGVFTGYRRGRTFAFTFLVCKKMAVDRDLAFTWRVRNLVSELLLDVNQAKGLHVQDLTGLDLARLLKAVEEFSTRRDENRL